MTEDRGDSESIGALLLVTITVISVSIVGGAMFAANSPTSHPNARIDATADGSTLTVEHRAGEPLEAESFEVVLRSSGTTFAGIDGDPVADWSDEDSQFEPGERWNFSAESPISSGENVVLVFTDGDRVLLDETSLPSMDTPTTNTQDEEESEEGGDEGDEGTTTQDEEEGEAGDDDDDGVWWWPPNFPWPHWWG